MGSVYEFLKFGFQQQSQATVPCLSYFETKDESVGGCRENEKEVTQVNQPLELNLLIWFGAEQLKQKVKKVLLQGIFLI